MLKINNSCQGLYNNSLDVRFTKSCDNNCSFCIEKQGIKPFKKGKLAEMVNKTISSKKEVVLILGGEPLIYIDEVIEYIKKIRDYKKEIYLTTSLPEQRKEKYEELLNLIDGLNISVHHYNYKKNNEVLTASNRYNRINFLAQLCESKNAKKIRLNANLCKGGLDTKKEILKFIKEMDKINVPAIKFQELQNADDFFISFEDLFDIDICAPYIKCQQDITKEIIEETEAKCNIILKRSCFLTSDKLKERVTFKELAYKIMSDIEKNHAETHVLYENGTISERGWLK